MEATLSFRTLTFGIKKTYLFATLFVLGNIILPQICHTLPYGGPMWLPIYFFTLIGAYKYGWKVGLLTAVLSPVINSLLFGMPALAALPVIVIKSILLATIAGAVSSHWQKATIGLLALTVLGYQITGSLAEWIITGSFVAATSDFTLGLPGMLIQIFGGWLVIDKFIRK